MVVDRDEWERRMDGVALSKQDLNRLVMDFLTTEGYYDAVQAFHKESGTPITSLDTSIRERSDIRAALQRGDVDTAVDIANDVDPEVLESQKALSFHLQQQRVLEMIRQGQIEQALAYAQEYLAPCGEENAEFLAELEQTIALLAFEDQGNSPLGGLLDVAQRQKIASELNAALLAARDHAGQARLPSLLKMMLWAQTQLAEKASFPQVKDLSKGLLADDKAGG